jgi:trans-aconitate methyltransferase
MKNWQQFLLILSMIWWQTRDTVTGMFSTIFTKDIAWPAEQKPESQRRPVPPARLRIRIGSANPDNYLASGPRLYKRLKKHVSKYASIEDFDKVLDWGCGCGRITRYMLDSVPATRLYGCDIDPDAISWMQNAFPGSSFTHINPYPPTPYADGFFDFIYGISVFTHLNEDLQFKWLAELRRVTRIDGILAMSVHGDTSTDPRLQETLDAKGFADREGDRSIFFKHFLAAGYYRLTKHNKEYVMCEWTKYFDILEIIDKGIGRQDLVIMRRTHD